MLRFEVEEGCATPKHRDLITRVTGCPVAAETEGSNILTLDTNGLSDKSIAQLTLTLNERFGRVINGSSY